MLFATLARARRLLVPPPRLPSLPLIRLSISSPSPFDSDARDRNEIEALFLFREHGVFPSSLALF